MPQARKFNAFSGVFTPSILTILGVIMYLRLPSIVGQAGLWSTIGIILVAHLISVSTGLSVAAIATDKKVEAGGTYYMISRSLGLPIGGTLGLALFVGLSFSVSLYVIGFSESFLGYWGWEVSTNTIRLAGTITLLVVTTITVISTSLALRMQFFIMAAIGLSLLSIVFGRHDFVPEAPLLDSLPDAAPFIVLFGIFFPAVTGFEAGVSMSGDLRDPKKDIPGGTIWAIAVGLVVYIGLAIFLSYTVTPDQLVNNPNVLLDMAVFAPVVVAGIWGATISSALGSILGAPRILQATAVDRITPRFFAKGYGRENEPRNALILTFVIAEAGILIGELDVIARIVSMFFITTYGFLNLSSAIESWASPDFRPEFRIPKTISIIGALACFIVMIQLDFIAMIGATVVLGGLYLYLTRKQLTLASGDTWEGVWSSLIRTGLKRLHVTEVHERNWRPNILLFTHGSEVRPQLIRLGRWLIKKRGLLSNFDLHDGGEDQGDESDTVLAEATYDEGFFTRRMMSDDVFDTMGTIASYHGFAGVEPNTVMLGWARSREDPASFARLFHAFEQRNHNILCLRYDPVRGFGEHKQLDVWWGGEGNNISLILALVRFLSTADAWREAQIRICVINQVDPTLSDTAQRRMDDILASYRIEATVKVITNAVAQKPFNEIVSAESGQADLTILGIPSVDPETADTYVHRLNGFIEGLGTVLFVKASSYFQPLSLGLLKVALRTTQKATSTPVVASPLPALMLPAPSRLAQVLKDYNEELEAHMETYLKDHIDPFYGLSMLFSEDMGNWILRSFDNLHKGFATEGAARKARQLQKVRGAFLYQAQQFVKAFAEENIPLQYAHMNDGHILLQRRLAAQARKATEQVLIPARAQTFAPSPADDWWVTGYKWWRRLAMRLSQTPPTYTVSFRELVQARVAGAMQSLLLQSLSQQAADSYVHIGEVQRVVLEAATQYEHLERILEENPDEAVQQLAEARQVLETALSTMLQVQQEAHQQARLTLQQEVRQFMQGICTDAERLDTHRLAQQDHKTDPAVKQVLSEAAVHWEANTRMVLGHLELELLLLSIRLRLMATMERVQEELHTQIRQQVMAKLTDFRDQFQAFAARPDAQTALRLQTAYYGHHRFPQAIRSEALTAEIGALTAHLPEALRTLSDASAETLTLHPLEEAEAVTVSLRRLIDYVLEVELIGPLQAELSQWPAHVQQVETVIQDVAHLANFYLTTREPIDPFQE